MNTPMRWILFLLSVAALQAQTIEVRHEGNQVHLLNPAGITIAQFELPAAVTATAGVDAVASGKTLQCATIDATTARCVVYGGTDILAGHIATLDAFAMVSGVLATDEAAGAHIPVAVSEVFSSCDLNQDGSVGDLDLLSSVTAMLAGPCPPEADLSGDGQCTVLDVQRVVNAALGAGCVVN